MAGSITSPSELALLNHRKGGRYRFGESKGKWKLLTPIVDDHLVDWPHCIFSVAASDRDAAPCNYAVRLHLEGYPLKPPTGTFWCMETNAKLPNEIRPRGKNESWIFRTNWKSGNAFYHPYDRVAAESHADWGTKYRLTVWTRNHTIVDLLEVIHATLHSDEYLGVGEK